MMLTFGQVLTGTYSIRKFKQYGSRVKKVPSQCLWSTSVTKILNLMARSNITTYNLLRTKKEPWSAHPYGDEHNHGNYREDRRDLWENNTEVLLSYNKENIGNTGIAISA